MPFKFSIGDEVKFSKMGSQFPLNGTGTIYRLPGASGTYAIIITSIEGADYGIKIGSEINRTIEYITPLIPKEEFKGEFSFEI